MLNTDTFLTALYVQVDDFCKEHLTERVHPGPQSELSRSEIVTLVIFGQWSRFQSERDFYRFADQSLRDAFPKLPSQTRFNRLARQQRDAVAAFGLHVSDVLEAHTAIVHAIDCTAVPVRDNHRRGNGWLLGDASVGHSNRIGWYQGFRLLVSVGSFGAITGYCFASGATNDRQLAEALFSLRVHPNQRVNTTGRLVDGVYLADKGFAGRRWLPRWFHQYGAKVIAQGQREQWPRPIRRWLAHYRQIVETVFEKLHNSFGLKHERPHQIDGFQLRLNARIALHNFCIWLNRSLGREPLAFASLCDLA